MAYRFVPSQPFDVEVRRVALQQIDRALRQLRSDTSSRPSLKKARLTDADRTGLAVHDARKRMKRIRALLRLARPGLDDKVYQ